jgi:hypothetical protein
MHTINTELEPGLSAPAVQILPEIEPAAPTLPRWNPLTRVAFRFCVVYFTAYILTTQMFNSLVRLPFQWRIPPPGSFGWFRSWVSWIATDVIGFSAPLTQFSGSGDKPIDYAQAFGLLCVAGIVTLLWSAVDRRRQSYVSAHKWFRLFLRFALAGTWISYGMVKAFPLQMSYPAFTRLLEPYGHFSLMGVLWAQIGASPAYERFTGIFEVSAAVLLMIPGLTLAGSVVSLIAAVSIFLLNMTYDVPVKFFSLHLILMSLVLLGPDMKRLFNLFVLNKPVGPSTARPLFTSLLLRRLAIGLQLVIAGYFIWSSYTGAAASYAQSGPNRPKPPLYGIWTIDRMTINGVERAALVTDYDRWRRILIQVPTAITFQRMDDTFTGIGAKLNDATKTFALSRGGGPALPGTTPPPAKPVGSFKYQQPSSDKLILDGELDGKKIRMEASAFDLQNLRLLQSRFRWIQDNPFNR